MARAVRYERYGGVEQLDVVEVERPEPGDGQFVVRVRAAGINPFEARLRSGQFQAEIPLSFPAAQGTDFAGVVERVGPNVQDFAPGDEVFGATSGRGSHAELAVASQAQALPRPAALPWEVAGGLWVVATTAYAAVSAVSAREGDLIVVAGASGGVGGLAAQLARQRGATVIGVAGAGAHDWLSSRGITPVAYGEGLVERLRSAAGGVRPDALIDTVGQGYVDLAIEHHISPERIDTIVDHEAAQRHGVKMEGSSAAANTEVLQEVASLIVAGDVELPIAATFPLDQVREAFTLLEQGHPPGKIVLIP